jgi:hypothetical protein
VWGEKNKGVGSKKQRCGNILTSHHTCGNILFEVKKMVTDKQIKNKIYKLEKDNWIVRSNSLNEIRDSSMSLTEMRLFAIYQSKINPKDLNSRKIEFELSEFEKIMEIKRANITVLKDVGERIVTRTAKINDNDGGFCIMPIFGEFRIFQKNNEWYVSIDTHEKMIPYLFQLKKYWFKYKLWNALRLKSTNQVRMYEILKQYEYAGAREIEIDILKALLGISQNQYSQWRDFRRDVLNKCQEALLENTDIKFTYEPSKKGRGGKIMALKFIIEKNNDYIDQLTLDEFIETPSTLEVDGELPEINFENEKLEFLAEACDNEFTEEQMQVLYDILRQIEPNSQGTARYDYLLKKYNELKYRVSRSDLKPLRSRFAYLKKIIEADLVK